MYVYDENGSPIGMMYRNSTMGEGVFEYYIFAKNLQGDITAVYDEYGGIIVEYTYDAWGNVTEKLYDTTSNGQYNSFRYRGYFYDEDTGLYYLNSRYYDPATGRFLNADIYVSTGQGLVGYNMYAYCNNNPISYIDPNGDVPPAWVLVTLAIVAVVIIVNVVVECNMPSKEEHYSRNNYNEVEKYSTEDKVPEDWLVSENKVNTTRSIGPSAFAHQFTSADHRSNVKYVSPDGKMEAIYDVDGNLVTDPRDMGTYNFCPSGTLWGDLGHYVKDIRPWIRWGNSPEDTTTSWERMWGLLGIYE